MILLPEPLHKLTERPLQWPTTSGTNTPSASVPVHALPVLVKNNVQLANKPASPPPHPTIAQVLTAIPLGFKMAYQQLKSPTVYGNQIAAYKIYKNTTANNFSGATLWETRPHDNAVAQKVVTLQDSTSGGGQNWYYFVSAVDSTGLESSPVAFQAGAITSQNANPNISSPTPTTSGPSTSSASFAVIPEMTATITTKGNKVLLLFSGTFSINTTGADSAGTIALFRDGVQISNNIFYSTKNNDWTNLGISYLDAPSAASHTYDVRWQYNNSGNGFSFLNDATNRTFQVVELG